MPRHNACDDFHRTSEAERRDFLGGAPLTRRQVLAGGLGAGLTLYAAQALPVTRVFEAAAADAAAAPERAGARVRVPAGRRGPARHARARCTTTGATRICTRS